MPFNMRRLNADRALAESHIKATNRTAISIGSKDARPKIRIPVVSVGTSSNDRQVSLQANGQADVIVQRCWKIFLQKQAGHIQ